MEIITLGEMSQTQKDIVFPYMQALDLCVFVCVCTYTHMCVYLCVCVYVHICECVIKTEEKS